MKHFFGLRVLSVFSVVAVLLLGSCRESTLINSNVSPSDNVLGLKDTSLPCITHTYYDDTVITSLFIPGFAVFQGAGLTSDPFFGTLIGSTHFQLLPVNPSIDVYKDQTIDSAVLVLPYSGFSYGDTADQALSQSYQVFFMNDTVTANALYYSNTSKQLDEATPLSEPVTVNLYHLKDSLSVAGVNYHPGLRVKLNLQVLLSRLIQAHSAASANLYISTAAANTAFHQIFKGVCVRPANSKIATNVYPFFRLDGSTDYSGAGILVYYHPNGNPGETLHQRYFFNGESCGYFNKLGRSYAHSPVNSLLHSTLANDSVIALQNLPGPCIDIVIPGISKLPTGMINKAEIRFAVLPNYENSKFLPIDRMYPLRISNGVYPTGTDAGTKGLVLDWLPQSSRELILDGRLHDFTVDGTTVKTYTIGIPREVMTSRAANNDTLHLKISGTERFYGAFRTILGGGNHPDAKYRAKLFVVYSTLN